MRKCCPEKKVLRKVQKKVPQGAEEGATRVRKVLLGEERAGPEKNVPARRRRCHTSAQIAIGDG